MRRRDVIKGAAAVTAGLASPKLWAEGVDEMDESAEPWIALLSDPHIDADAEMVVRGVNMAAQLEAVTRRLLTGAPAEHLIINGDLARDTGEAGDYAVLRGLLAPLEEAGGAARMTLGNHDHRQNFIEGMGRNSKTFLARGRHHQRLSGHGAASWILLDSLRETDEIAGEVGPRQRDWLAEQLDAEPDTPAFIVVHHQPEDPKDPDDDGFGLADGKALLDLVWDRKQVKAVFHGHRHAWGVRQVNGMYIVGLPATSYVFEAGEPTGYVEARVRADHVELTRRCLALDHPAEGEVHRLAYR